MTLDPKILDEATEWAVRTSEPDFDAWPAFTDWLERSPEHGVAYDRAMMAAAEGIDTLRSKPATDAAEYRRGQKRGWYMPAVAACLALAAALWIWQFSDGSQVYVTAPGETRMVALADGSSIVMAGGTELVLIPGEARQARLEKGQALFQIRHDESDPFRLEVGSAVLVDAGTVFDVNIRPSEIRVGVSEGAVIYNPEKQNAWVQPGQMLTFGKQHSTYTVSDVPIDQVGEWRQGRLTFRDALLTDVASEVSRVSGIEYRVSGDTDGQSISGSFAIEPLRSDPAALGPLLGKRVERQGEVWVLVSS